MLDRVFSALRIKKFLKFERDTYIDVDSGVASATAGAATLHRMAGVVTSEAITTAAGSDYTLTLTNNKVKAGDIVLASIDNGTNTTLPAYIHKTTAANGSVVFLVRNGNGAAAALNGTIKVSFLVLRA